MTGSQLSLSQALQQAVSAYKAGRLADAESICLQILAAEPGWFDALHVLAAVQAALGKREIALATCERSLAVRPDFADGHYNKGAILHALKRSVEAVASYDRALDLQPDHAPAWNNRGNALRALGRYDEAVASFDRALNLQPGFAEALRGRAGALDDLGRHEEALAAYDRVLTSRPDQPEVLLARGNILQALQRYDDALASYDRALAARPAFPEALTSRGNAFQALKRFDEALASHDAAIAARPDYPEAHNNRGVALRELKRHAEAVASYDRAVTLRAEYADALANRGNALHELKRYEEALPSFERALTLRPDHRYAFGGLADCAIKLCDWPLRARIAAELPIRIVGGRSIVSPFVLLGYSEDLALQQQCARQFVEDRFPDRSTGGWTGPVREHGKIRIAYLSGDFRQHPMSYLIAELFELHDRERFEVIGVSFGPDDSSAARARIASAFDAFHDVRGRRDDEVVQFLRDLEVDIAVDLMGHTMNARTGVFARRAAPIQVSYLGFPATMGAEFIDYIIADPVVLPLDRQPFYSEKIVHLPDCYWVNDRKLKVADQAPDRAAAGLPEHGFVFCCLNAMWKITPEVFDVWMRLLDQTPGAVLWLYKDNETAAANLRREAERRGIDPQRLVFAGPVATDQHLARHRLADLLLDTLPYNAHTTASDALWVGLPIVTCMGEGFAGRVAASMLKAVGLDKMVAGSLEDYESLALTLARDQGRLEQIHDRLANNRNTLPLFDTPRFARHLEAAYEQMSRRFLDGKPPEAIRVAPED